ncbi:MAG: CCA tRNA nucleotidyltransferase [bacterium]|nr:CCA tRNA nucleotidyltransferase [bacterium]
MKLVIPEEVKKIGAVLQVAGFKAYLVGGCLRDLLLGAARGELVEPKDWDVTTDARPEKIQELFPDSVYENAFGTVGVKTESADARLKVIEVTTFRKEGKYTDKRHPDNISFAKTIEEDLERRDFTMNAIALRIDANLRMDANDTNIMDPFGGQSDLKKKILRTVGDPEARFSEDALRLLRAVRLAADLGFEIEAKTAVAVKKFAGLLEFIAKERIRDEFTKIVMTSRAAAGVQALEEYGLLKFVSPELREGIGVGQNKHHIYSVWEHNLRALDYAVSKNYSFEVRLASLLHDVAKPRTKAGEGSDSTFYGHDVVGAKMAAKILDRLHFSKKIVEDVSHLVRYHLFYYNVGEVSEAGVRRFLARVGPECIADLIKVREADRIGSGVPKAVPYKLRHLLFMIEKVKQDPVGPKMLAVKGEDVMKIAELAPGPKVGAILAILLEEVLDDPKKNAKEHLETRIRELAKKDERALEEMTRKAKERKNEFEEGVEAEMKKKYYVQ